MSVLDFTTPATTNLVSVARSTATKRRATWNRFHTWCHEHNYRSIPMSASVLDNYIRDHVGTLAYSTLKTRIDQLRAVSLAYHIDWPENAEPIRAALQYAKEHGTYRGGQPLTERELTDLADYFARTTTPHATRDWALIAVGAAAGMDAHEIADLKRSDFTMTAGELTLRFGKRRPWLGGITVASHPDVRRCPVTAMRQHLEDCPAGDGPLFTVDDANGSPRRLTPYDVTAILRRRLGAVGRAPGAYSWLSLRGAPLVAAARARR